jgi:hypothetical protein
MHLNSGLYNVHALCYLFIYFFGIGTEISKIYCDIIVCLGLVYRLIMGDEEL